MKKWSVTGQRMRIRVKGRRASCVANLVCSLADGRLFCAYCIVIHIKPHYTRGAGSHSRHKLQSDAQIKPQERTRDTLPRSGGRESDEIHHRCPVHDQDERISKPHNSAERKQDAHRDIEWPEVKA